MRKIILIIDLYIMIILSLLYILNTIWIPAYILLFYYSIIKSFFGIILFIKNILQNNLIIKSKNILLFIPSLILILYLGYFVIDRLILGYYVGWIMMFRSIILVIGILALLSYLILNKKITNKIYYNVILAIVLPFSYYIGFKTIWAVFLA